MGATGDQIDDLSEWEPGPPAAARARVLSAFAWGLRRAGQSKTLIFWLWLAQFLLLSQGFRSWLPPVRFWMVTNREPFAWGAVVDVSQRLWSLGSALQETMAGSLERPLWTPELFFILFYGVLAGGAIAYLHAPRTAPFLAQFGAASGLYFGRFVRLLMSGALGFWILLSLVRALEPDAPPGRGWLVAVVPEVCVALLALTIDYARVRTVARDSRSMLIEIMRTVRFVVRHLPRLVLLQVLLFGVGLLLAAGILMAARGLDAAGAGAAGTFASGQAYVVGHIWLRLVMWGSMLSLYQGLTSERLSAR